MIGTGSRREPAAIEGADGAEPHDRRRAAPPAHAEDSDDDRDQESSGETERQRAHEAVARPGSHQCRGNRSADGGRSAIVATWPFHGSGRWNAGSAGSTNGDPTTTGFVLDSGGASASAGSDGEGAIAGRLAIPIAGAGPGDATGASSGKLGSGACVSATGATGSTTGTAGVSTAGAAAGAGNSTGKGVARTGAGTGCSIGCVAGAGTATGGAGAGTATGAAGAGAGASAGAGAGAGGASTGRKASGSR